MKVKLGELTKIRTGKLDANAASEDGTYPFFTCSKEPLRISTYSYNCECVLVAGNGDLNAKYYNGIFDAYQRTYIIESNGDGRLHLPYLYHFMTRYIQELRKLSIGGVIKYIKLGNLTDVEISLPSIKEQKDACEKLKKVKNIINKKEAQISYLDNLIKARFVEMFGDKEEMKISGYIDSLEAGKSLAGTEKCENKVLKTGAVSYDYFDNTQTKYLPKDYQPLNAHKVNPGDVIISRMNTIDLVGAAAYVWNVPDKVYLPDRLWKAKIKNDANPVFVWQTIIHPKTKKLIRRMAGGTSGSMKNISKNKFLEMLVKKATREEQDQFAAFVAQVDKSKFALSNELAMCNFYVRLINDSITHSRIDLRMSE